MSEVAPRLAEVGRFTSITVLAGGLESLAGAKLLRRKLLGKARRFGSRMQRKGICMTGPVFVDTNVLVYRHDITNPVKQSRADEWYELLWRRRCGRLSFQVLQELYSTLTRKLKPGLDLPRARQLVRVLATWRPLPIDLAVLERAWLVQDHHLLSWWDALIVGAAQACNCEILLTEDLQHGQRFGTVLVVDPFAQPQRTPAEILEGRRP